MGMSGAKIAFLPTVDYPNKKCLEVIKKDLVFKFGRWNVFFGREFWLV
jgi:hypothetical protein